MEPNRVTREDLSPLMPPLPRAGLADIVRRRLLTVEEENSWLPLHNTLVVGCTTITGRRAIEIEIDGPSPAYTIACEDTGVVLAGRRVALRDNIHDVLARFPHVFWRDDKDLCGLFAAADNLSAVADRVLLMRDAALALIAVGEAMRRADVALVGR